MEHSDKRLANANMAKMLMQTWLLSPLVVKKKKKKRMKKIINIFKVFKKKLF